LLVGLYRVKLPVKNNWKQTKQIYQNKKISSCVCHLFQVPVEWERVGFLII
jgi:hypothetical protein